MTPRRLEFPTFRVEVAQRPSFGAVPTHRKCVCVGGGQALVPLSAGRDRSPAALSLSPTSPEPLRAARAVCTAPRPMRDPCLFPVSPASPDR